MNIKDCTSCDRAALDCLRRIVSYYDDPRVGNEWRGLPSMTEQAKCQHESTMFGEARALLLRSNQVDTYINNRSCKWAAESVELIDPRPQTKIGV